MRSRIPASEVESTRAGFGPAQDYVDGQVQLRIGTKPGATHDSRRKGKRERNIAFKSK